MGTNTFDVALIFLIDASYPAGPVLNEVGAFSSFAAVLGIIVTLVYATGLIERRNRTLFGVGIYSWAVLGIYFGGVAALYSHSGRRALDQPAAGGTYAAACRNQVTAVRMGDLRSHARPVHPADVVASESSGGSGLMGIARPRSRSRTRRLATPISVSSESITAE